MTIRGIQQTSLVDFPGEVCTSVFFGGCNCRCPWCHNADLVLRPHTLPEIKPEEVLSLLLKRRSWIEAVCLTGGEPTLAPGLEEFIAQLKEHGFLVKLDTNGTFPEILARLLEKGLLDYVAMDIKSPLKKYSLLTGVKVDREAIRASAELLKNSEIPYEFRTTVVPGLLEEEDLLAIGRWLFGARRYVLQQFRPRGAILDSSFTQAVPYPSQFLHEAAAKLKYFFAEVEVRE